MFRGLERDISSIVPLLESLTHWVKTFLTELTVPFNVFPFFSIV